MSTRKEKPPVKADQLAQCRCGLTLCAVVTLFVAVALPVLAQTASTPARPPYLQLRFDEDWSSLKDPSRRTDSWDWLKYVPLNDRGWYLSLGGEGRLRYERFANAAFGSGPQDGNGFLLQRYLLHCDVHTGRHLRFFTQFQSGLENGRVGGPRATDKDELEIHQAFVDFKAGGDNGQSLTLRVGRQELEFGSAHFISASETLNVRRSFDGALLIYRTGPWTWNSLVAKVVELKPGIFNDTPDHRQTLWGVGTIGHHPLVPRGNASFYYIGLDRKVARFDQAAGHEVRHSLGTRSWGKTETLDYNYEFVYQWGRFAQGRVRAWAAASDTGYTLHSKGHPRAGLRADISSGDRDPGDKTLNSFNPMFPGTAYSGRVGLIGPTNSIDLTPSVRVSLTRRLVLLSDCSLFWRQSVRDGTYGILVNLQRTGQQSSARYVGTQPSVQLEWRVNPHVSFAGAVTRFLAGRFLKETPPGKSVTYLTTFLTYKF